MRILHIPHSYYPNLGGLEYHCTRLSEELVAQGHEVRVLVPDIPTANAFFDLNYSPLHDPRDKINGVSIRRIPFCDTKEYQQGRSLMRFVRPLHSGRISWTLTRHFLRRASLRHAIPFIRRELETYQPDVVMTTAHMLLNMHWLLEIHRATRFPLVQMPLVHYDVQSQLESIAPFLQQGNAVLANSTIEKKSIQAICHLPEEAVFVGSVGTDIDNNLQSKTGEPYVLVLGRKVQHKGIDLAIATMQKVWQTYPRLRLVLAGARGDSTHFLATLLAQLPTSQRANIVEFDNVTETQKQTLLRNALCLLFPSQSESFGLVLIEAMAQATPPITWDIPLFREIVTHDETGLLSEIGNVESLATQLLSLIEKPHLAQELGEAGHQMVKRNCLWSNVAQRYLKAYQYAQNCFKNQDRAV